MGSVSVGEPITLGTVGDDKKKNFIIYYLLPPSAVFDVWLEKLLNILWTMSLIFIDFFSVRKKDDI
jgi:hypothetical protein